MEYTLVTGATSDIGRQICQTLAADGHNLLLSDLSEEALCETRKVINGTNHLILPLDLSDVEGSKKILVNFLSNRNLSVSNAVFAAGIFTVKPLKMMDYEFIKKNFDISIFSLLMIMQVLTSRRINGKSLHSAVMISSVSALMGTKGYAIYGAVKASMLGIVKSLAVELAPHVRINAVLPGGIRTKATNFLYEVVGEHNPRYLLGEGKPSDIADMILFLLSDKSRWITGQQFVVDGGLTIC